MLKWHAYGRCKTRLSKDIGKFHASYIQKKMTEHTVSVAKFLEEKGYIDISLAISGVGLKRGRKWSKQLGIENFNLQGQGCLGEKMRRQIIVNKKFCFNKEIKNIIIIGSDLPDLCHLDILNTISKLKNNDIIFGPSNDGGYWLIAFSERLLSTNLYLPFINIKWSKENVLQRTISNFSSMNLKHDFLCSKTDIDMISDIQNRD